MTCKVIAAFLCSKIDAVLKDFHMLKCVSKVKFKYGGADVWMVLMFFHLL